jgi:hypothetical protein
MSITFNGSEITVLGAQRQNHGVYSSTSNTVYDSWIVGMLSTRSA